MRVVRRFVTASAGATLLAVSGVGLFAAAAAAAPARTSGATLVLGTTAGIPNHAGYAYDGQPATQTLLQQPRAVATDASGDVFIADAQAHVVREITPDGVAHLVAGVPGIAGSDVDRAATGAHLTTPSGVLATPAGVLVADPPAHRVLLLHGGTLSAFAGNGSDGEPVAGPDARATGFRAPTGLAYDGAGSYFVSDAVDDSVWRITSTGAISLYAGSPGHAGNDAGGKAAVGSLLSGPTALTWASGHLVVADTGNSRIRTVSSAGLLGDLVAPGAASQPTGLVTAGGGQVYVADAVGRVGVVAGAGISWYAGANAQGFSPDGTPAASAGLVDPTGVAIGADGRVLVAEAGTAAVRDLRAAAGPPGQPLAPQGTAGDGYVDVVWQPVADGGSPVTSWLVQAYAGTTALTPLQVSGSLQRVRITGLTDGVSYTVRVTAVNALGASPASAPSATLIPRAATYTQVGSSPSATPTRSGGGVLVLPTTRPTEGAGATGSSTTAPTPPVATYLHLAGGQPTGLTFTVPTLIPSPGAASPTTPADLRPTPRPASPALAPVGAETPAPSPVQSLPLVPVRSFADAATDVAAVGKKSIVPLVLVGVLGAFLVLQGVVDRRDPKLAKAPLHADRGLEFGPA